MTRGDGPGSISGHVHGHVLLELLVVLTVMGVAGALVAPAVHLTRREDAVGRTARELVLVLRRARLTAEERRTAVTLILDPATGRTWYTTADRDEALPIAAEDLPLDGAVTVDAPGPRMRWTFSPGGLTYGAPLRLRSGEASAVVTVDPWSGEARVSR